MLTNTIIYPKWDIVRPQAQGRWHFILPAIGIDSEYLKNKHGPCPVCGGKDRFRFDNKDGNGSFFCGNCQPGDGFRLVELYRNCSPKESLKLVADVLGCKEITKIPARSYPATNPELDKKQIQAKRERLQKVWKEGKDIIGGGVVHTYLTRTRKLPLVEIPPVLRAHPGLPYYNEDMEYLGTFPVMLAKIENLAGELVNLHRTYLTTDGRKAFGDESKKLMTPIYEGATKGAAIRLYPATETLVLGEGIETSFCGALCLGLPAWACVSDYGLANVVVPPEVHKVIALVDNDESGAGQKAAEKLAIRVKQEGRLVKRLMPEQLGADWLDVLTNEINQ